MTAIPVPNLDANSVILLMAIAFTALTLHLTKSFFQNGPTGPIGSMNLKAVTSLTLLNSIMILALAWGFVFVALRASATFERAASIFERMEQNENARTAERN